MTSSKSNKSPVEQFHEENERNVRKMKLDKKLRKKTMDWMVHSAKYKYTYLFSWLGRPIIQFPQDMVIMQEILWKVKPDLLIETGIAHGGSLVFYASILELVGKGKVLGIDIDIRSHNKKEIEKHRLAKRITMIQGSSTSPDVVKKVQTMAKGKKVLVILDSNHTHQHVLAELNCFAPLVTKGSYCVVFDTIIEDMTRGSFPDRPWDKGNNPKTAVWEYLKTCDRFEIDKDLESKLLITVAPDGFLKCVKN